ncbi:MAG TPA: hypothetical protein VGO58_14240 [Chitinophagaceae bacterium]|jgi:hypothetical protein|nr:hypothetical protein [Chitinophagaceae bacterium]
MKKLFVLLPLLFILNSSFAVPLVRIDTTGPVFANTHIMIITLRKEIRAGSETTEAQKGWKLTSSQAMEIFKTVTPVSEAVLAAKFAESPAFMNGKCRLDATNYTYEINAGGFLTLTEGQQVTYYGCYNKNLRKYFLTGPK